MKKINKKKIVKSKNESKSDYKEGIVTIEMKGMKFEENPDQKFVNEYLKDKK